MILFRFGAVLSKRNEIANDENAQNQLTLKWQPVTI